MNFFNNDKGSFEKGGVFKVQMPEKSAGTSFQGRAKDFFFSGNGKSLHSVQEDEKFYYNGGEETRSFRAPTIKTTAPSEYSSYDPQHTRSQRGGDGLSDGGRSNATSRSRRPQEPNFLNLPPSQPFRRNTTPDPSIPDSASYYGEGLDAISLPSRVPFNPSTRAESPVSDFSRSIPASRSGSRRIQPRNNRREFSSEEEEGDDDEREFIQSQLKRSASSSASKTSKSIRRVPPPPISISSHRPEESSLEVDPRKVQQPLTPSPAERSPGLVASWRAAALDAKIKAQAARDKQRRSLKLVKKFQSESIKKDQGREFHEKGGRELTVEMERDFDDG